jgi:hypothetical protein
MLLRLPVSYSKARQWFHLQGFPVFDGFIFWDDFVLWRHKKFGLKNSPAASTSVTPVETSQPVPTPYKPHSRWTGRAARILAEFS